MAMSAITPMPPSEAPTMSPVWLAFAAVEPVGDGEAGAADGVLVLDVVDEWVVDVDVEEGRSVEEVEGRGGSLLGMEQPSML